MANSTNINSPLQSFIFKRAFKRRNLESIGSGDRFSVFFLLCNFYAVNFAARGGCFSLFHALRSEERNMMAAVTQKTGQRLFALRPAHVRWNIPLNDTSHLCREI
jgi:hypothetical protein